MCSYIQQKGLKYLSHNTLLLLCISNLDVLANKLNCHHYAGLAALVLLRLCLRLWLRLTSCCSSRLVARVFCLAACFLFCVIYEIISHTHTWTHQEEGEERGCGSGRGVAHTATHNDVGLSWTAARLALACLDG